MDRKGIEKMCLTGIDEITGNSKHNHNLYVNMFKGMSNKDFEEFMLRLKDGDLLQIIVDYEIKNNKISVKNNIEIAKKSYNYDFFQYTYTVGMGDLPSTRSMFKNYVTLLPYRVAKQTVDKGVSVSEDAKHFNILTGQPSGASRSAKISMAETQLLVGMGLHLSAEEFNIDRSDVQRSSILIGALKKYGAVSKQVIEQYGEVTRTTKTLRALLTALHLKLDL